TSTPNPSNPTYSNDLEGVVVASGGAGYMFEGTNGTFTASFNDAVSNGQLRQYAKGPYLDAWRGRVPVKDATTGAALPFMMATFYWESWKKNDGSFLCFRACAQICNSLTNTPAPAVSYTYDLDWKNGAAVIRGTSNQDRGFTTILHTVFANYSTFDHSALPDWSVNDAPLKAIIVQRDAARIDQFKHCGVVPPIIGNLSPTLPTPVTPFTSMGWGAGGNFQRRVRDRAGVYGDLRVWGERGGQDLPTRRGALELGRSDDARSVPHCASTARQLRR